MKYLGLSKICKNVYDMQKKKDTREVLSMAVLDTYNINAMAPQISREFYIDGDRDDQSHVLVDEMRLFAIDMKSRVTFISRMKK